MKKNSSIAGIILGIVIIALGFYLAFGYDGYPFSGTRTMGYTFGADYYTEQYAATENAANNVLELGKYFQGITEFILATVGLIVAAFGGVISCYFGCKLADIKNPPVAAPTAPITVKEETPEEVAEELPDL